jgi:hypothetical protein
VLFEIDDGLLDSRFEINLAASSSLRGYIPSQNQLQSLSYLPNINSHPKIPLEESIPQQISNPLHMPIIK